MLKMKKTVSAVTVLLLVVILSSCEFNVFINTKDSAEPVQKTEEVTPKEGVAVTTEKTAPQKEGTVAEKTEETVYEPFYGVWCYGGKKANDARNFVLELREKGFDAEMFVTTEWSNLNAEMFYVVTAGVCETEQDAKELCKTVKANGYKDAYVKYSGNKIG